jgi:hypothetical protein
VLISSHRKLLLPKAMVVSVAETAQDCCGATPTLEPHSTGPFAKVVGRGLVRLVWRHSALAIQMIF